MENITEEINKKQIRNKIYSLILPITIENILQMVAGMVSMSMIGRIDVLAIGALGISMRITQIIWSLFKGITTGATVFVAQSYGANNYKKMRNVIQQTILSSIILVIILQILVYFKAPLLLSVFNPTPELMDRAVLYMRTVCFGLPFLAIMLIVGGVLQGMGNAKTPMKITLIMNVINIAVAYVLIFGKLGVTPMGIKGAAIATVVSQAAAACIGLYVLFSCNGVMACRLNKDFFRADVHQISDVYRVGMPTAMESIFWQIAAIILTRAILTYGETAFAAHQMGMQAESISYMPAMGFGVAATALVGQALGAKDKFLAKAYIKEIIKGALLITSFSVIILVFFPKQMMGLLTNNTEIIKLGAKYLILMGLVQLPQNASGVLLGTMRGAGHTKVPMIVAGAGLWGVRVPFTLLVAYVFKLSIVAIWGVMCIDLVFRFLLSFTIYKKKDIYESTIAIDNNF